MNTKAYTARDEYLLLKYRYETTPAMQGWDADVGQAFFFSKADDIALWNDRKQRHHERVFRRESIAGATVELKQLPQPRRSRAKRLPQPKDAAPAANTGKAEQDAAPDQAEAVAQDATPQEGAANPQPSRSSRRRRRKSSTSRATKAAKAAKDPHRVEVERILARHLGGLPVAKKVDILIAALEKTDTKGRLYNFLRGNLGKEEGLSFYRDVKGCIDDLRAIECPAKPEQAPEPTERASEAQTAE